jgi:hypothetical protein
MNVATIVQKKAQRIFGEENAKTIKGESLGWLTLIRYLAPADESGVNVCPKAGACKKVCLYTSGKGGMPSVKAARIAKTLDAVSNRKEHLARASTEILSAQKRAKALGLKLAVRLNGTSDLPDQARQLAQKHPDVQFYDYTKIPSAILSAERLCIDNLHYTLSYDPETVPWELCDSALNLGISVAVCFDLKAFGGKLPATYKGFRVIDGDAHDLRFLDKKGVVVGLKAKGDARRSNSFVVTTP